MYAIQHKRTKKFVYGTDKRYSKFRQRTSSEQVSHRLYEIVQVELIVKGEEHEHERD